MTVLLILMTATASYAGTDHHSSDNGTVEISEIEYYYSETGALPAEDARWQQGRLPGIFKDGSEKYIWLRARLPAFVSDDPSIYFEAAHRIVEVQIDEEIVFSAEKSAAPRYFLKNLHDWFLFVHVEPSARQRTMLVKLYSEQFASVGSEILFGDYSQLMKTMVGSDLPRVVAGIILIIAAVILLVFIIRRGERNQLTSHIFQMMLLTGFLTLSWSKTLHWLITGDVLFYLRQVTLILLPVELMAVLYHILSDTRYKIIYRVFSWVLLISGLTYLLLFLSDSSMNMLLNMRSTYNTILFIILIITFMMLIVHYRRNELRLKWLANIVLVVIFTGLLDTLMMSGLLNYNEPLTPWGFILILLYLLFTVENNYFKMLSEKRLIEEKSSALAVMSHEIRTPMTGVVGMTELLSKTRLDTEQLNYLKTLKSAGNSLLNLVNDILDYSKIESGRMQIDESEFDLHELIEENMATLASRAYDRHSSLFLIYEPHIPRMVYADRNRISQIINNLLSNAIKFTEKGRVYIEAVLTEKGNLRISVTDTGIGIHPESMRRLFKPFSQIDHSISGKYGGTGLGLVISENLIHLMQGEISVESEPDKGSTFSITLPAERIRAEKPVNEPVSAEKKPAVYLHDDDEKRYRARIAWFRHWGYTIAGSFAESDISFRQIAYEQTADISRFTADAAENSILILPVQPEQNVVTELNKHGKRYFIEPVFISQFREAVSEISEPEKTEKENSRAGYEVENLNEAHPFEILVAEDNIVNRSIIVKMLNSFGYEVDTAGNGREAVEKFYQKNYDLIFMDFHMPVMDGIQAAEIILSQASPVIIAMTADAFKEDREKAEQAGMRGFLPKPVTFDSLKQAIITAAGARAQL